MTTVSARRAGLLGGVVALVVLVDQVTKSIVEANLTEGLPRHVVWTLQWNLQYNPGVAFSTSLGSSSVATVIAVVVIAGLTVVALRAAGTWSAVVFGLILGGAVGNLADRLFRDHGGAVVDFVDFRWWPVFNVADAALSVGIALGVVAAVLGSRGSPDGGAA